MVYICTGSLKRLFEFLFLGIICIENQWMMNVLIFVWFLLALSFCCQQQHIGKENLIQSELLTKWAFSFTGPPTVTVSRQSKYKDCLIAASCKMWHRVLHAHIFSSQVPESCLFLAQRNSIVGSWLNVREYMYACTCLKWFQLTQGFQ